MSRRRCTERLVSASEVEKWAYCPLSWLLSKKHRVTSEPLREGEAFHNRVEGDLKRSIILTERSRVERLSFWIGIGVFMLLFSIGIALFILLNLRWWKNLTLLFTFLSALFLALSLYSFQRNFNVERGEEGGGGLKKIALAEGFIFGGEGILLHTKGSLSSLFYMGAFILIWYLILFTLLLHYSLKRKSAPEYILCTMAVSSMTFLFVVLFALLTHLTGTTLSGTLFSGSVSYALLLISLRKIKGTKYRDEIKESLSIASKGGITVIFFATAVILLAITGFLSTREGLTLYGNFSLYLSLTWLIMAGIMAIISVYHKTVSEGLREWVGGREVKESMASGKGRLLISPTLCVSGRPDAIVQESGFDIPVEIKHGRIPRGPHFSHIMQLSVYLHLIEKSSGVRPPYGYIRYISGDDQRDFRIDWTEELEGVMKKMVREIREAERGEREVHRNHRRSGKCRYCSRREVCPERLA